MKNKQPQGELTLSTLAMPADTNANGDIFGGWLVSQMDLAAGILAKKRAKSRCATIAIDQMVFKKAVQIGDVICVYCDLIKVGRTSMTINVQVWAGDYERSDDLFHVTEGIFTFVALNCDGRPQAIDRN